MNNAMNNPTYIMLGDKKIRINTDFRYALKCSEIAEDTSISDYEKIIGIIYTVFNSEDMNGTEDEETLLKLAQNYLQGRPSKKKEYKSKTNKQEKDMDYIEDWDLIVASMWHDYNIDVTTIEMHWWTFFDLLNGLSGNCILNQIREIRSKDLSKVKDRDQREELIKLKEQYKLRKEIKLSKEQQESIDKFYELTGIDRK